MQTDKRLEERIPVEKLPECLQNVAINISLGKEYPAKTVNASGRGMGFIVNGLTRDDLDIGQDITIKVDHKKMKLKAKVIYVNIAGSDSIRFGACFHKKNQLDKYNKLLDLNTE